MQFLQGLTGFKRLACRWCWVRGTLFRARFTGGCLVFRKLFDKRGQGTVEYAVVMAGFLAMMIAMGLLWRLFEGGLVVDHALAWASHHLSGIGSGVLGDVFLF